MSDYFDIENAFINSLVGEGTHFTGNIRLDGLLRIDGDFSGTIKNQGKVLIGRTGRAECTIQSSIAVIAGSFKGEINCEEKVIILSTALVLGEINAPKLVLEEGALFSGKCNVASVQHKKGEASVKNVPSEPESFNPAGVKDPVVG